MPEAKGRTGIKPACWRSGSFSALYRRRDVCLRRLSLRQEERGGRLLKKTFLVSPSMPLVKRRKGIRPMALSLDGLGGRGRVSFFNPVDRPLGQPPMCSCLRACERKCPKFQSGREAFGDKPRKLPQPHSFSAQLFLKPLQRERYGSSPPFPWSKGTSIPATTPLSG